MLRRLWLSRCLWLVPPQVTLNEGMLVMLPYAPLAPLVADGSLNLV